MIRFPHFADPLVQRAMEYVAIELDKINSRIGVDSGEKAGNTKRSDAAGSIRIQKIENGKYRIALKTEEGWIVSDPIMFRLQERIEESTDFLTLG